MSIVRAVQQDPAGNRLFLVGVASVICATFVFVFAFSETSVYLEHSDHDGLAFSDDTYAEVFGRDMMKNHEETESDHSFILDILRRRHAFENAENSTVDGEQAQQQLKPTAPLVDTATQQDKFNQDLDFLTEDVSESYGGGYQGGQQQLRGAQQQQKQRGEAQQQNQATKSRGKRLRSCVDQEYTQGSWIFQSIDMKQPVEAAAGYHCSQYQFRNHYFCARKQKNFPQLWTKSMQTEEDARTLRALSYTWTPKTCSLSGFNATRFVAGMKGDIFFIGDSITNTQFVSLCCRLGQYIDPAVPFNWNWPWWKSVGIHIAPGNSEGQPTLCPLTNGFRLYSFRSDSLGAAYGVSDGNTFFELKNFTLFWKELGKLGTARSTLVLNTAAHWRSSVALYRSFITQVGIAVKKFWPGQVVFRTSVGGHAKCRQHQGPVSADRGATLHTQYNWNNFLEFNAATVEAFEGVPRFRVLNMSMLEERPDGHVQLLQNKTHDDCLHYCLPGPMEIVTDIFAHLMLQSPS